MDTSALRGLLPARIARPYGAEDEGAWLLLFAAARLAATVIAFALVAWAGFDGLDALLLAYGPLSTLVLVALPAVRRAPRRVDRGLRRDAGVRARLGRLAQPVLPAVAGQPRASRHVAHAAPSACGSVPVRR